MKNLVLIHVVRMTKLFTYAFLLQCLSMSFLFAWNGNAQVKDIEEVMIRISLDETDIEKAFSQIEELSGYSFVYTHEEVRGLPRVSANKNRQSVYALLSEIAQQTGLQFRQVNQNIHVRKSGDGGQVEDLVSIESETIDVTVTGTVTDESGEPLPGVTVSVLGTTIGTATDLEGKYSLSVPGGSTLVFSFIGFDAQEVQVRGRNEINVVLVPSLSSLDEVVVIGYGTTTQANLSGSVSTVNVDKVMGSRPATNVASLLEGQVSGVFIHQNSGQPGAEGMNILIRGQGSMGDSQPLVIIDGMESSMDNINPFDIESISVLKDAASASIYGTRAANGVILITTKRGKAGPIQVRYNTYFGKQDPTEVPDFLGSADYARLHNEARINAGLTPSFSEEDIRLYGAGTDPEYPSTDWMKQMYSGSGSSQYHGIDFSGGTEITRYNVSMAYNQQRGVIKNVDSDQGNFRLNLDNKVSNWLNVGLNTAISHAVNTIPLTGPELTRGGDLQQFYNSVTHIPPTQKLRLADGSWSGEYPLGNFAAWIDHGNLRKTKENKVVATLLADGKLFEGLIWKNRASVDYTLTEITNHISQFTYGGGQESGPSSNQEDILRMGIIDMESLLTYNRRFGKHGIKGLLGTSIRSEQFNSTMAFRLDFPSNELTAINAGGTTGLRNGGTDRTSKLGSYFTRVNYDFAGKFIFEANLRRDGSSKFAGGKRWGWFPSFSAGWVLTEEPVFKSWNWLDFLKVRGSYGKLGNHRIADYLYIPRISLGQNYTFGGPAAPGAAQITSNNPDITWETTTEKNLGIDLEMLENSVSLSIDVYDRYTDDILTVVPVSSTFGLPAPIVNAGAMRNKGLETELGYRNNIGEFQYDFSLNGSYNDNNVEKYHSRDIFEVNAEGGAIVREEGTPWNSYIGYEWIGYFQTDEEALSSPVHNPNVRAGDLKFKDQNNDGKIDAEDRVIIGNPVPKFTYGFGFGFRYKGLDFSTFFHGTEKVERFLRTRGFMPFMRNGKALRMHLDRNIVQDGEIVEAGYFPRTMLEGGQNIVSSSFLVHDASYLRMKNIQVGYTLPSAWTNSISITRLRIYFSGENLLTFTKFPDGYDPEANTTAFHGHVYGGASGWSYPQVKFYTLGLNVNF